MRHALSTRMSLAAVTRLGSSRCTTSGSRRAHRGSERRPGTRRATSGRGNRCKGRTDAGRRYCSYGDCGMQRHHGIDNAVFPMRHRRLSPGRTRVPVVRRARSPLSCDRARGICLRLLAEAAADGPHHQCRCDAHDAVDRIVPAEMEIHRKKMSSAYKSMHNGQTAPIERRRLQTARARASRMLGMAETPHRQAASAA